MYIRAGLLSIWIFRLLFNYTKPSTTTEFLLATARDLIYFYRRIAPYHTQVQFLPVNLSTMKLLATLAGGALLISQASALAISPTNNFMESETEVNHSSNDNTEIRTPDYFEADVFLSHFLKSNNFTIDDYITNDTTTTTTATTSLEPRKWKNSGFRTNKIPLDKLPPCYRKCFDTNCCNMWVGGPKDVRLLTPLQFCWTRFTSVSFWMRKHLAWCLMDECDSCLPGCRDGFRDWVQDVCHYAVPF